jgi:hypothetical protein
MWGKQASSCGGRRKGAPPFVPIRGTRLALSAKLCQRNFVSETLSANFQNSGRLRVLRTRRQYGRPSLRENSVFRRFREVKGDTYFPHDA